MKHLLILALISGCTTYERPTEPYVSRLNQTSVVIELNGNVVEFMSKAEKETAYRTADELATRACKKPVELINSRPVTTSQFSFVIERLYTCI